MGSKIGQNSVTYYLNGPLRSLKNFESSRASNQREQNKTNLFFQGISKQTLNYLFLTAREFGSWRNLKVI